MACSRKRKVDSENRSFKDEWTEKYAFILPASSLKPLCLICNESVAVVKSGNVKRHYETKHSQFEKAYPLNTEARITMIDQLKSITFQERALECSLKIAWVLGRHKDPFSDAEMVKECMLEVSETLFEGKQKIDFTEKIKLIPLSDSTAMIRMEILAEDLISQLDSGLKNAPCISLAVDESTDIGQFLVFVRFYDGAKMEFCEDLLGVTSLEAQTQGEDIHEAIKEMLTRRGINQKFVVSLITDGAPSMIGSVRGLVGRLKKEHPDMLSYHCIIYESVLCASLGDEYAVVMEKMLKLVNFLRTSSTLQHRQLCGYLTEVSTSSDDLLLHNNVRWFSKGRVLERFWGIRKELQQIIKDQPSAKANQFSEFLQDDKEMEKIAFLADITSHLNALNVKLQGGNNTVCDLLSAIRAFQKKLELFKYDLQGVLDHFPRLMEHTKGRKDHNHTELIDKLTDNFKARFDDFSPGSLLLLFTQNPFLVANVSLLSDEARQTFKWVNGASIQMELIELQENVTLKEEILHCDPVTFWTQKVSPAHFPSLQKVAVHVLTMFGSTYCCESAFSTMNLLKNKYQSRITDEHLHHCLRLAVTSYVPKFRELARNNKCCFSH